MRARNQVRILTAIHGIRTVQRSAAEIAFARADAEARERRADAAGASRRLEDCQTAWAQSLTDPRVGVSFARAWMHEIAAAEAGLKSADARVRAAEDARTRLAGEWNLANARSQAAGDLASASAARARRKDEETRLNDLTDLIDLRRGVA